VKIVDNAKFLAAVKVFMGGIAKHPSTSKGLPYYGTDATLGTLSSSTFGALPTRNFTSGSYEHQDKINGDALHDTIVARGGKYKHGCNPGCVIQCSQVYVDKDQKYMTSGLEYETIWGLGANCCIPDLDIIAKADYIMDDIGVDSIEMVATFGVAMEAGILPFGDGPGVLRLLSEEMAHGTPLGRILGSGAGTLGKVYGVTRVPVVKNQALSGYDPRSIKGIGITFATSPMGADHTAGYTLPANLTGAVPPRQKDGQIALSRQLQIMAAAYDGLGLCSFTSFILIFPEVMPALMDMINARSEGNMTPNDFVALGTRILKMEHQFNLDAGLSSKDDRLPEFFSLEPVPPTNAIWDFTGEEIDTFWNF
jgi:aldehyde:ferredoxin oxidoreductase